MITYQQIHFVINPAAGQAETILSNLNQALAGTGIDWRVSVTTVQRDGATLTQQAVTDGADLIVAHGGDGTVKSVIHGLADTDVPLALMHGGTGNAMAYELAVPEDTTRAVGLFLGEHRLRPVDIGKVVCDVEPSQVGHFILRSSIGLQNRLLEEATPELKQQFGNMAYIAAGLRSLSQRESTTFNITVDGQAIEAQGLTCIIANSTAVGGEFRFNFASGVSPDDGLLDVFVLDAGVDSLMAMLNSSLGSEVAPYPNHWQGQEIRVEMAKPSMVTLDGEPFSETPLTATVMAGAVQVVVPMTTNDAD